ncbi:MAG TPA: phosphatase PAP2 family protein [Pseudomonadales bacterium]|jgi:membrane-associated phospholipid phosphatase|nr:phosphatase PAP2 family protein [Pseudomonadales bacterium]HNI37014.1 phosphatase PAP2 family protein [Pseudomonadales bacterium]HNN87022.1 phosphatase PAP2 family protein [Pseudomonadales bacterium]
MTAQHWRGFMVCQLLGLGLLASWLLPATRALWDTADQAIFYALNGTLNPAPSLWGAFWALLSFRPMDLLALFSLLPFLLIPDLLIQKNQRATACIQLFLILAIMLAVRLVVREITDTLEWRGFSPSRTLQPVYFLSQLYPHLNPKDASNASFPGDHAAVLMIVVSFLLLQRINRWSVFILAVLLLFLMPRLIAGAHWFTDVVVGGTLIATQSMAYGYFTPWPKRWAEQLAQRWVPERWR